MAMVTVPAVLFRRLRLHGWRRCGCRMCRGRGRHGRRWRTAGRCHGHARRRHHGPAGQLRRRHCATGCRHGSSGRGHQAHARRWHQGTSWWPDTLRRRHQAGRGPGRYGRGRRVSSRRTDTSQSRRFNQPCRAGCGRRVTQCWRRHQSGRPAPPKLGRRNGSRPSVQDRGGHGRCGPMAQGSARRLHGPSSLARRLRGLFELHLHVVGNHTGIDQDSVQSQTRNSGGLRLGLAQFLWRK